MTQSHWTDEARTNPELEATRDRWNERFCMSVAPQPVERGWPWWLLTMVQLTAVSLPIAFLIGLIRIGEALS